jgi:hypothetical protein
MDTCIFMATSMMFVEVRVVEDRPGRAGRAAG